MPEIGGQQRPGVGPGRLTPEQHRTLHEGIRKMLRLHLRPSEIRENLMRENPDNPLFSISESALFRHLAEIREENRKFLNDMAKGQFTDDWRNSKEILENQVRYLVQVRADTNITPQEKQARINASLAICEIEGAIMDMIAQGPTVWAVQNALKEQNQRAANSPEP